MEYKFKFAINENTIFQCDLLDYLYACIKSGFHAVEISYVKLKEILRFIPIPNLLSLIRKNQLNILALNAFEDVPFVPEENLKIIEEESLFIGRLCEYIHCPAVIIPSGRWYIKYGQLPEKEAITEMYRKRLILVKETLNNFKVTAMFEPIAYSEFVVGSIRWINEIMNIPQLKDMPIVPDIHNLYVNREGSRQLELLRNPIGLFHIDDTINEELPKLDVAKSRCFPGDGIANAVDWVKSVYSLGYRGYLSLELFNDDLYKMLPSEAAQLCRNKLDAFADIL